MRAPPKTGRPHIAVAALLLCGAAPALAQADHYSQEQAGAADPFDLHIPDIMLAGERYAGVVVAREPAARDRVVLLASSDPRLGIPDDVVIPQGRNHGIFGIAPDAGASGIIRVHAAAHGHSHTATTNVYGGGPGPALALFGAQSDAGIIHTSSRAVPLLAYLVGDDGSPVPAESDIPVRFSAPGHAQASRAVATIGEGEHFAAATLDIRETGTVRAWADGVGGDSVDVLLDVPGISLRIAVSPPAAPDESYLYYHVWAERDGAHHVPADPVPVTMSTSDAGVARFTRAPPVHGEPPHLSYISDGIARGVLYTGSPGSAVITASAPGLGSASAQATVRGAPGGEARHGDMHLALFVHPENPAGGAWAVLSAYVVPPGSARDAADAAAPLPGVVPATLPKDAEITLAGDGGVSHRESIRVHGHNAGAAGITAIHAVEFPVLVEGGGPHSISAHAGGMAAASISFGADPRILRAEMIPLPALPDADAPLAMLFALDGSGRSVDIPDASGAWAASDGGISVTGITRLAPSALVIYGVHRGGEAALAAHAPGLPPAGASIEAATDPRAGISLWVPDRVHASEAFPAALHYVDGAGAPLEPVPDFRITSEHVTAAQPPAHARLAYPAGAGAQLFLSTDHPAESGVGVISRDGYLDGALVSAFVNDADGSISVLPSGSAASWVGEGITLGIAAGTIPEPSVDIKGPLDFAESGPGEYTAVPAGPGTYDVVVTISGEGFEPHRDTLTFEVSEKPGTVLYSAASDDHSAIDSSVTLTGSGPAGGGEYLVPSGGSAGVPPGTYAALLAGPPESGGRSYSLDAVTVNGDPVPGGPAFTVSILGDTLIESAYVGEVRIRASSYVDSDVQSVVLRSAPEGGGLYGYGDPVEIRAPVLYEYGVVRHSPLRWDGLPAGASLSDDLTSAGFGALRPADIHVHYSRDYTILYAILAAAALAAAVPAWLRPPHILRRIIPGGRR